MNEFKTRFGAKTESEMNRFLELLRRQALTGKFIYRGEPEIYPKVSSSLYRQCDKKGIAPNELPNSLEWCKQMWELQKDIVAQSRRFLPGRQKLDMYERSFWNQNHYSLTNYIDTEEYEILCQLQHYGGSTNLVDFTADYFVALFFACEQKHTEDGRIILSEMLPLPVRISDARVQAQKSFFVQVPDGFMKPENFSQIEVAAEIKIPLLLYLKQYHAISSEALFPDIQGAVRYWNANQSSLFRIQEAIQKNREKLFDEAVEIYGECISLSFEVNPTVLMNRSIANFNRRDWQAVRDDLTKAIAIFEKDWRWQHGSAWGFTLFFRAVTLMQCQCWDEALQDMNAADERNFDIDTEFCQRFKCITTFENDYGLCLPDRIKDVLPNHRVEDMKLNGPEDISHA